MQKARKFALRCQHCSTGLAVAQPRGVTILYVRCPSCHRHARFHAELEL